ncbi:peptidylprolyl isomerase [Trichlorobacter ammonificans]|uniref:peptidylprolyl isomerase n=1 Tax=Trichlorobacter ammonificans TaxID=2916410 RepID=A0ABM9D6Y1_9BACT|nr:peptidylprolyl isomerase [Trichlorobacter ammonificans]CAH2030204.1 Foldase protein PrsA precursor [Trichlorobacter ammonificans]
MNTRTVVNLALIALAALSLTACQGQQGSSSTPATSGKDAKVLASVNGVNITSEDFDREVKALPEYIRGMTETPQGRKEMIETLVMRELILQQAAKDGVDKSKDVEEKMAELKKRIIVDTYLKKRVESDAKISDEELKSFYEKNQDKFKTGEQVRASHILVKSEQEAKDVLTQLKGGAKFEDVAKAKSVDSSASKGGDLGWFGKGNMVPVFEKTAFALKEGEVSGIVKSEFGFHIIKLTGKRAAGVRSLDEAKEQIKAALLPQKQQQAFMQLKETLRKGAKIELKEQDPAAGPEAPAPHGAMPAQPAPAEKK